MVLLAGIEEAGRGPVIGPLVMCGVLIKESDEYKLVSIGAKDSKLLTPKTREVLYDQILNMVEKYKVIVISPQEIDEALLNPSMNLNWLEAVKMAEIINELNPDKVILDCPSTNPKAYAAYVRRHLKKPVDMRAEHKADVKYTVVAASSIIAKVTRDREIEKIKKKIGVDFGSGYPSDEITQKFLQENWEKYPDIFRKTWISYKKVASGQSKLSGF